MCSAYLGLSSKYVTHRRQILEELKGSQSSLGSEGDIPVMTGALKSYWSSLPMGRAKPATSYIHLFTMIVVLKGCRWQFCFQFPISVGSWCDGFKLPHSNILKRKNPQKLFNKEHLVTSIFHLWQLQYMGLTVYCIVYNIYVHSMQFLYSAARKEEEKKETK